MRHTAVFILVLSAVLGACSSNNTDSSAGVHDADVADLDQSIADGRSGLAEGTDADAGQPATAASDAATSDVAPDTTTPQDAAAPQDAGPDISTLTDAAVPELEAGTVLLAGAVLHDGETLTTPVFELTALPGTLDHDITVSAQIALVPPNLPPGFTPVGAAVAFSVAPDPVLDLPLLVKLYYRGWSGNADAVINVLHRNSQNTYEPVTILGHDPVEKYVLFAAYSFSDYLAGVVKEDTLPEQWPPSTDRVFSPSVNGWPIANFDDTDGGSPFSSGGNCLGMSSYAVWFYQQHRQDQLASYFTYNSQWPPPAGVPPVPDSPQKRYVSIAHLLAIRAHQAQSQGWAWFQHYYDVFSCEPLGDGSAPDKWCSKVPFCQPPGDGGLPPNRCFLTARERHVLMKWDMSTFQSPVVLRMHAWGGDHAGVLYRYQGDTFFFYDVNYPATEQSFTFQGDILAATFNSTNGYSDFGYLAIPPWEQEFVDGLTTSATNGFIWEQCLFLTQPPNGNTAGTTGPTTVKFDRNGTSCPKGFPNNLYLYHNYDPRASLQNPADSGADVQNLADSASFTVQASEGRNVLVLLGDKYWYQGTPTNSVWKGLTLVREFFACPTDKTWNGISGKCEHCPPWYSQEYRAGDCVYWTSSDPQVTCLQWVANVAIVNGVNVTTGFDPNLWSCAM